MRGVGIKMDTMTTDQTVRCLDVTRLVSRADRGPFTGVDRVEWAYLQELLSEPTVFGLARIRGAYALFDKPGLAQLARRLSGEEEWGDADWISRWLPKLTDLQKRIHADIRRFASSLSRRGNLQRMIRTHIPDAVQYLNVGHTNLTGRVFAAFAAVPYGQSVVLVHDMIPLTHPAYQRPETPARFEQMMRLVSAHADGVIYNSAETQRISETYFEVWGRVPPGVAALLGIDIPAIADGTIPADVPATDPYFVSVGTLEPRKNHSLLLDVWDDLARTMSPETLPKLFLVGTRGWSNQDFFDRLEAHPLRNTHIFELSGLPDTEMGALIAGARAMLFPSHAEGFGLPPAEAAALGTRVICANLAIYQEFLGDYPVYADINDRYLWTRVVHEMATINKAETTTPERIDLPTWKEHFNVSLKQRW